MTSDELLEEIARGDGEYLSKAARRFPRYRRDSPVTISCLTRWISKGVEGPGGERVFLEAARMPGGWVTTAQAVIRFIEAQTPDVSGSKSPTPRSPGRRRKASERAAKALERVGI